MMWLVNLHRNRTDMRKHDNDHFSTASQQPHMPVMTIGASHMQELGAFAQPPVRWPTPPHHQYTQQQDAGGHCLVEMQCKRHIAWQLGARVVLGAVRSSEGHQFPWVLSAHEP